LERAGFGLRLATKLSFAEACSTDIDFVPQSPSTEVRKAVLGFAAHAAAWLEHAPLPEDEGDVLVIQIDGKGAPMATERELEHRRAARRRRRNVTR